MDKNKFTEPRKWMQVYQYLLGLLDDGTITPGQPMPTASKELPKKFGTGRHTAMRAMQLLAQEKRVILVPGYGYYAAKPPEDQ
jgi:DNA-binding GntR family transcriptional regulator